MYLQTAKKMFTAEIKLLGSDILHYLQSKKRAQATGGRVHEAILGLRYISDLS